MDERADHQECHTDIEINDFKKTVEYNCNENEVIVGIGDPPGSLGLCQMRRLELGAYPSLSLRIMILLRTKLFSCMSNEIMGDIRRMTLG